MSFPKFVNMTKNTPFFSFFFFFSGLLSNFARFCTRKRCTHVHFLVMKNNPNYVIFLRGWYDIQLQIYKCQKNKTKQNKTKTKQKTKTKTRTRTRTKTKTKQNKIKKQLHFHNMIVKIFYVLDGDAGFRLACRSQLCRYATWLSLAVSELQRPLSSHTALALSAFITERRGIAPEFSRIQLSAICRSGQSGKVIDLLARRCLPLGHPSAASGACAVVQISSSTIYAGFRLACRLPLCRYAAWSSLAVSELQLTAATPLWLYHRAASLPSWIEFNCLRSAAVGKAARLSIYNGLTLLAAWSSLCGKWRLRSWTNIIIKAAMR